MAVIQGGGHQFYASFLARPLPQSMVSSRSRVEIAPILPCSMRARTVIADLVAIEVQDRQHGPVGNWVEELVGLP